jgi:hypothetical protein
MAVDTFPGRTVPFSPEAEMSVLGAMMLDSEVAGEVIEIIDSHASTSRATSSSSTPSSTSTSPAASSTS